MDSDQIGRIGEELFALLCARAGLYCNKSSVDRMGWDYIVESPKPLAEQPSTPLDQRTIYAARIQVKSTLGRSRRIRLSLSAVDRLVKDPHPAFIVVLRLRGDGELDAAFIVHLIGKELARILKRLRLAEAKNAHDINQATFSYDFERAGLRFEPTPGGLQRAIGAPLGQNSSAYTLEKQRQLAELGYEEGHFEAEALLHIESPEHLSNVLLGLTPLKPLQLRVFDKRFGIRIPYKGTLFDTNEELHLTPPTLGHCEISIRGPNFGQAARFDAQMFIGPPITEGPPLLVRSSAFIVRPVESGLRLESVGSIDEILLTLEEWAELLRALTLLSTGRASMTISGNARIPAFTFPVERDITGPYLEQLPLLSAFADGWLRLLANAGLRSSIRFKLDEFWNGNNARMAVDILLNKKPEAHFEFQNLGSDDTNTPPDGIYYNDAFFAGASITYSARVFFERTDDEDFPYRSTHFEAINVRPKVDNIHEYGIEQATALGITLVIDPRNITMMP